jgi:hypothetical protein
MFIEERRSIKNNSLSTSDIFQVGNRRRHRLGDAFAA